MIWMLDKMMILTFQPVKQDWEALGMGPNRQSTLQAKAV